MVSFCVINYMDNVQFIDDKHYDLPLEHCNFPACKLDNHNQMVNPNFHQFPSFPIVTFDPLL